MVSPEPVYITKHDYVSLPADLTSPCAPAQFVAITTWGSVGEDLTRAVAAYKACAAKIDAIRSLQPTQAQHP